MRYLQVVPAQKPDGVTRNRIELVVRITVPYLQVVPARAVTCQWACLATRIARTHDGSGSGGAGAYFLSNRSLVGLFADSIHTILRGLRIVREGTQTHALPQ